MDAKFAYVSINIEYLMSHNTLTTQNFILSLILTYTYNIYIYMNLEPLRKEYINTLQASVQQIVSKLSDKVIRISIFGSYARGKKDLFTDLDILIIMDTKKTFLERLKEIYSLVLLSVDTDILIYTPEEFACMKNKTFLKKILAEEVVVFWKRI